MQLKHTIFAIAALAGAALSVQAAPTYYMVVPGFSGTAAAQAGGTAQPAPAPVLPMKAFMGTAGADVIAAPPGWSAIISGLGGDDVLLGGEGTDKLIGGAGNDQLQGAAGGDQLIGGPGNDIMSGGAGPDSFEWNAGEVGQDDVLDFNPGEGDVLKLSGLLQGESAATLSNYLNFSYTGSATVIAVRSNGGAVDAQIVLHDVNLLTLGADDAAIAAALKSNGALLTD